MGQILIAEVVKIPKFGTNKPPLSVKFVSFDRDKLTHEIETHYKIKLDKDNKDDYFPWFSDGGFKYTAENELFIFEIVAYLYDII